MSRLFSIFLKNVFRMYEQNVCNLLLFTYIHLVVYFVHVYLKKFYFTYCCANIFQIFFVNNSTLCIITKRSIDVLEKIMFTTLQKLLKF